MKQDLRIQIYFATEEAPHAPEGPGWYIVATRPAVEEGATLEEILPRVRLNLKDMPKLAKVIDKFTEGKPLNWVSGNVRADISLEQAVDEATTAGKEIIKQRLAEAEDAVRRLSELRARVEEFDE